MQIINIEASPRKNKRFRVTLDDGNNYDFGLLNGNTYIDHHDKRKRDAYRARHMSNKNEKDLIDNLVPSPALFSMVLLWGPSIELDKNIRLLNYLFNEYK